MPINHPSSPFVPSADEAPDGMPVLEGADADEDTAMITVLLHHGRRVRALNPFDLNTAVGRARAIAGGRFVPAGVDQDIIRLVSPTVQAVLAALTATEVLSSGR